MARLSAGDYYVQALRMVGEHGSDALTIAGLCAALRVTKGSFYHHFGSLAGFTAGLLAYWEDENGERLTAISRTYPDASLRLGVLTESVVGLPHATEAGLRSWGRSDPDVAAVTARVDRRRERHLTDAVAALGIERQSARLLGRIATTMLIGAQQRENPVDVRRLRSMFDELNKLIFAEADPTLVARLLATSG